MSDEPGPAPPVAAAEAQTPSENSYARILKSSAMLGGSSVINTLLGAVRTKVLAVQLGPALFGTMGLYVSLTQMIQSVAGLGLGQSAVREIAAAAGSGDQAQIARTITAYRRVVMATGLAGLLITIAIAYPASLATFTDPNHAWAIALLSTVVLFGELQAGQLALLQGLRRIRDISALTIVGALMSTAIAIPLLLIFRERGIVPFLIAVAAGQTVVSWWYARRVEVEPVKVSWAETWRLSKSMLHLGLSFVATSVATAASVYAIRLIIGRQLGTAAVGLYTSAFTVSGIYVGFILQAMGGDYYPRLAGLGEDAKARNQLVNEQTKAAIMLAAPGLVGALVLSDLLIHVLYSARFAGASEILRWQVLGLLGRILSWPLGFILLARGDSRAFLATELAATVIHVGFVWIGTLWFGAAGAGMAFAGLYLCYGLMILLVVRLRHGFAYASSTVEFILGGSLAVLLAFGIGFIPNLLWRSAAGLGLLAVTGLVCLDRLASLVPDSRPARWYRLVRARLPIPLGPQAGLHL